LGDEGFLASRGDIRRRLERGRRREGTDNRPGIGPTGKSRSGGMGFAARGGTTWRPTGGHENDGQKIYRKNGGSLWTGAEKDNGLIKSGATRYVTWKCGENRKTCGQDRKTTVDRFIVVPRDTAKGGRQIDVRGVSVGVGGECSRHWETNPNREIGGEWLGEESESIRVEIYAEVVGGETGRTFRGSESWGKVRSDPEFSTDRENGKLN